MLRYSITTPFMIADDFSDELTLLGASAISWNEQQGGYEFLVYFEDESVHQMVTDYLNVLVNNKRINNFILTQIQDQPWERVSLDLFEPILFGNRLWVCPAWHEQSMPSDAIVVLLDPDCAFGTGSHPTTALCLTWLERNIKGDETLIDYGTGSGILALAALKLGAAQVFAIDNDEKAIDACRQNSILNSLSEQIAISLPNHLTLPKVDILVANILLSPLCELAPQFANWIKPNGKLVLSGILSDQIDSIITRYSPWFTFEEPSIESDWVLLEGKRKD